MARIRSVKPEFWTDEAMAELSRDVRLLFLGLLNHVDDDGRCVDNPRLVKAAVFPLDDDVTAEIVRRWLDELAASARIVLYEASGKRFLQVANFAKHQKIDRKTNSKLPAPDDCNIISIVPGHDRREHDSSTPRRDIVEPSLPDLGSGSGIVDQGSVSPPTRRKPKVTVFNAAEAADFETFWSACLRKVSKHEAREKWRPAVAIAGSAEPIIAGMRAASVAWRAEGRELRHVPHPATWLHNRRWQDFEERELATAGAPAVEQQRTRITNGKRYVFHPGSGWMLDSRQPELEDYEL